MCGIYGIVGSTSTKEVVNRLEKLQYRGYDSCGIAYKKGNSYEVVKAIGNMDKLKQEVSDVYTDIAIGHTRWATHGEVTKNNCHPHTSEEKRFYIVHNGVIDNYKELINEFYMVMSTETDSEVIVHLMDYYIQSMDIMECLKTIQYKLKGSYAVVILDTKTSKLYFIKNESPLLIGIGNNKIVIASDQIAFEPKMNVTILNDLNYGYIENDNYHILSLNYNEKWNTFYKVETKSSAKISKYYMLDEILEQPNTIKTISKKYKSISLDMVKNEINNASEIAFVGAGSSNYACSILKHYYEKHLHKRCHSIIASEIDSFNVMYKNTLFIFLSQSGETADLCYSLKLLKEKDYKIISLCNNINSTLGYKSDMVFPLLANEEISVASTKVFTAMIYVGLIILDKERYLGNSSNIYQDVKKGLNAFSWLKNIVPHLITASNVFYIGKGVDYIIALEGALKIREVAYLNSYAFQSGELKHGSIALIDSSSVCIAINSIDENYSAVMNNLEEVKSRGAKVFTIIEDSIFKIIPQLQTLAFLTAKKLNRNIDQPKNLAKSVTVK